MWSSRWRCVIKRAHSVSFLLSINIFVWQNVLYFLDAPRTSIYLKLPYNIITNRPYEWRTENSYKRPAKRRSVKPTGSTVWSLQSSHWINRRRLKYPNNKSIVSNACHLSACHVCLVMYDFWDWQWLDLGQWQSDWLLWARWSSRTLPHPGAKALALLINEAGKFPNLNCDCGKFRSRSTSGSVCYYSVQELTYSPLFKTLDAYLVW